MKKVIKVAKLLGLFLVLLAAIFGYFIFLSKIIEFTLPIGWQFYEPTKHIFYTITLIFFVVIIVLMFDKEFKKNISKKIIVICAFLAIVSSYIFASNIVVFTEDNIIVRKTFNPKGKEYSYKDIERVNAYFSKGGFIDRKIYYKNKGDFLYDITLDGKIYTLRQPDVNSNGKYSEKDSYFELEDLDKKLVEMGVEKKSSDEYFQYNDLDNVYRDRFLRIINNI